MLENKSLFEGIGIDVGNIQAYIMGAYEELNALMGNKVSGTKYAYSYDQYSSDPGVQSVLNAVANGVKSWNPSICSYTNETVRWRIVYLVASVIPAVARKLYRLSLQVNDNDVHKFFEMLTHNRRGWSGRSKYAYMADMAYSAWLSAIELGVPTRRQTEVEEDYNASRLFHDLLSVTTNKTDNIRKVVADIVSVLKLREQVTVDEINSATRWVFLYDCLKNDIFGAEKKTTKWYSPDDSLADIIYKYTLNSLGSTQNNKDANKANSKDTALSSDTNVVKDMSTIGQNTEQMNMLTDKSSCTCFCYFKIYTQTGLSCFKYGEAGDVGYYAYKIMYTLFKWCKLRVPVAPVDEASAERFSAYVKDLFESRATRSTQEALNLRNALVTQLDNFKSLIPPKNNVQEFNQWYGNLFRHSPEPGARQSINEAIKKIMTHVLYVGKASVSGETPSGESINANYLASPVVTFGDSNTTDRNTSDDLNEAGRITKGCFDYSNGVLTISYNGRRMEAIKKAAMPKYVMQKASETGASYVIDTIPSDKIQSLADNYVSSKLMPAVVSKSKAWIMLYGLVVYSKVSNGDMEDSVDQASLTHAANDLISTSNIMKDTRINASERATMTLSSIDFIKGLVGSKFMDSASANNSSRRIDFVNKVNQVSTDEISDSCTKIRAVCDEFTKAVVDFARRVSGMSPVGNTLEWIYSLSPKLDELISGSQYAVDDLVFAIATHLYPDKLAESYDYNQAINRMVSAYYAVADCKQYYSDNSYMCLDVLMLYASAANRSVIAVEDNQTLYDAMISCLPPNYDELHDAIVSMYDTTMADKRDPVAKANKYAETIAKTMDSILSVDSTAIEKLNALASSMFSDMMNSNKGQYDVNLRTLHHMLNQLTAAISKYNITPDMLVDVKFAIAEVMDGDVSANVTNLSDLRINQFVLPLKTFIMAKNIAKKLNDTGDASDANDDDVLDKNIADLHSAYMFAFDDGGETPMEELTPFHPKNIGNAYLKTTRLTDENAINSETLYNDMPFDNDYLEKILTAAEYYEKSQEVIDEDKEAISRLIEETRNLDDFEEPNVPINSHDPLERITQEYRRDQAYIQMYANAVGLDQSIIAYYLKCANKLAEAKKTNYQYAKKLDNIAAKYPSFKGLIYALHSGRIMSNDLRKAMKLLDIAATQRDSTIKYSSYNTANAEDAAQIRQFAFTESDESTIAQIMCVLGMYIAAPHVDTLDDLIDSLSQIDNIINKYSKNVLSVKVSSHVLGILNGLKSKRPDEKATDEQSVEKMNEFAEELVTTIVNMINQLGGFLLSRNHDELDTDLIDRTSKLERPNVNDATYGSATDSFARAQLRAIPNGYTADSIKHLGNDESAVRRSYIDLVRKDINNNPELAKFAYALGNAFNAFDRTLTDERVDNLDDRSLSSVESSLTEVGLFNSLSTSDLQRELVSAVIDDERNRDTTYPTVKKVVDAASQGDALDVYSQMYSAKVGSQANILNDQRNVSIAFDENGNKTTPENAVPLPNSTITALATRVTNPSGEDQEKAEANRAAKILPYTSIKDLVHSIRMCVFDQLYRAYGEVNLAGNIKYTSKYADISTKLMDSAMRKLYNLCDGMETPIADIILVSTSLGRKLSRLSVMKQIGDQIKDGSSLDLEYAGMVSNEPNAYPQMMSDEASKVDEDWINGVTQILSLIPDTMSKSDVLRAVELYNGNDLTRQQLAADDDGRDFLRVVDKLLRVDTETGIPVGFWGNDSTKRKQRIQDIFNRLCYYKTDDVDWDECAEKLREIFMDAISRGGNLLTLDGVPTSDAAKRRIGHLRLNPYYATNVRTNSNEYREITQELLDAGVIESSGRIVKTKYPGITFDIKTFNYIVNLTINLNKRYELSKSSPILAFLTTLMLFVNGMRIGAYVKMRETASVIMAHAGNKVADAENSLTSSTSISPKIYDEMIKTALGWITAEAYAVLCANAVLNVNKPADNQSEPVHRTLESEFINSFNSLTAGGKITDDIGQIDRAPTKAALNPTLNVGDTSNGEESPAEAGQPVADSDSLTNQAGKPSQGTGKPNGRGTKKNDKVNSDGKPEKVTRKRVGRNTEPPKRTNAYHSNTQSIVDDDGDEFSLEVNSNAPEVMGTSRNASVNEDDSNDMSAYLDDLFAQNPDIFKPSVAAETKPKRQRNSSKSTATRLPKRVKTSDFDLNNIISDDDE